MNPALNVKRRNEDVATDTFFCDTPAIRCGHTIGQLYYGLDSHVTDVQGVKWEKQFVNTLLDNIRKRGAPTRLLSDSAQVEISNAVKDILRALHIGQWQSEAMQQNQNAAERRYQTIKRLANKLLEYSGAPDELWLLAMEYVCFLLNHMADELLNGRTPIEALTGRTPDISVLLRFHFYEAVYYVVDDTSFPSESNEELGWVVGISENVGHSMTYKILTKKTQMIIHRASLRSAEKATFPNKKVDNKWDDDTEPREVIKARVVTDEDGKPIETQHMVPISPDDVIGKTFLLHDRENGETHRAKVVEAVDKHLKDPKRRNANMRFKCSINDGKYEEVMAYNDIIDHLKRDDDEVIWKFKRITGHEGPLNSSHPSYKGSNYNVMVEWETGEISHEPLSLIATDDPVSCAIYAKDKGLLNEPGWKRFKSIAKRQKQFFRRINQAKLRSYKRTKKYMYGYEVPHSYDDAVRLDKEAGNTKWQDSTKLEMQQLDEYDTFEDMGKGTPIPSGYKKIRVHLIFAVKHDGRFKSRCVADGHLTDTPLESVYSGVVSLRSLRLVMFLAELNDMQSWATDIGNAYLEAKCAEKVAIIAGSEFGELEGHTLIIRRALYGLKTSGKMWFQRFYDCLRQLEFQPSKADPCVWMRLNERHDIYEYVAVYVDDLAIAMRDPKPFIKILTETYKFKLKGTGPITFHLGCDFFRDRDDVLCMAPRKYIDKMVSGYERMFGDKPKKTNVSSPLEKGDHPECDESDFLDVDDIQKYQSLIG